MSYKKGVLFIISAPSGSGKTTLLNLLREEFPDIEYSVSHTTRSPRPGETDGRQYYFITKGEFEKKIAAGDFLEYAVVYDNYYGTSISEIEKKLSAGKDIVMDIDPQGAMQMKEKTNRAVYIFIMPPSIEELRARLKSRNDTNETMELRLRDAAGEIAYKDRYDYVIVNDKLEQAYIELSGIYKKEKGEV